LRSRCHLRATRFYFLQFADVPEEIDAGYQDAETRSRSDQGSFEKAKGGAAMKSEKLEVVRGSGNIFRDLGVDNADAQQFKAILAAEIIKALDREHLTVRAAHSRTGIAAADFSRIRNADLGRFSVDRLMSIINRLGSRIEVKVRVRKAESFRAPTAQRFADRSREAVQ
jgi:predicted XRE-type DNA-binding protein